MRSLILAALLIGSGAVVPAVADDVHLVNGRVFEDVIAVVEGDRVHLHLAFGEMSVPLHTVERVVEAESSLEEIERRRHALESDPRAGAADWLELARWAHGRGHDHAARQAALEAARRDPSVPGLAELMRSFGYVFDVATGSWLPYEERMRRQGYQRIDGRWLSPEQQLAHAREQREAERARRAEEESRLTRTVLALAAAELARAPEPAPPAPQPVYSWPWAGGVAIGPGYLARPRVFHHRSPPHHEPIAIPIERRQPGSLFPIAGHHRGGVARSPSPAAAAPRTVAGTGG